MSRIRDVLQDVATLVGFGGFSYGLWLFEPWVCYSVCGVVLMWFGTRHPKIGDE